MEGTGKVPTPLSVDVSAETNNSMEEDPMSPTGRVMEELGVYTVLVMGLSTPVNLPVFLAGVETQLIPRFPRFQSIPVMDGSKKSKPRWVRTAVKVEEHIIVPKLDPAAVASDPDKAVEDYVASLSTLHMDKCRPLWEFHFLDFPTSEATSTMVLRLHHALGDGTSIITLLMASSCSTADPERLPAMPPPPRRTGAIYQRRSLPGPGDYLAWVWSYLLLAWHTLVDVLLLNATILFLRDPRTIFSCVPDGGKPCRPKRIVHRSLSFEDVKLIKTAMNCTINDVLVGVTSAALSKYYFRKSGDTNTKRIYLRSLLAVNTRPVSGRQTYVTKVETGNRISALMCPFHIALHNDPLEYVRDAKRIMQRKKSSLEAAFVEMLSSFGIEHFGVKLGALMHRRVATHTSISLSNVVGPAEHITLCGHPITFMAISTYGNPHALILHYLNYGSTIKVALAVDDERFPDCDQLLDDFAESVRLIKDEASLKTSSSIDTD